MQWCLEGGTDHARLREKQNLRIHQRKEETGSSFLSLLWKELAGYVSLASFCTMNVGLIIYFLFNTEGLFGNFFKTVPFIDGLAAGAVIGIVLQRMTRTKEEDKKEEDEELAKQKEAEALGYIDYRSFRA